MGVGPGVGGVARVIESALEPEGDDVPEALGLVAQERVGGVGHLDDLPGLVGGGVVGGLEVVKKSPLGPPVGVEVVGIACRVGARIDVGSELVPQAGHHAFGDGASRR